jgi:hypothetical protein
VTCGVVRLIVLLYGQVMDQLNVEAPRQLRHQVILIDCRRHSRSLLVASKVDFRLEPTLEP